MRYSGPAPPHRLRRGQYEGACSDLRSALAAGDSRSEEAKALLTEAEAGAAMSSCTDPEAKGRGKCPKAFENTFGVDSCGVRQ